MIDQLLNDPRLMTLITLFQDMDESTDAKKAALSTIFEMLGVTGVDIDDKESVGRVLSQQLADNPALTAEQKKLIAMQCKSLVNGNKDLSMPELLQKAVPILVSLKILPPSAGILSTMLLKKQLFGKRREKDGTN